MYINFLYHLCIYNNLFIIKIIIAVILRTPITISSDKHLRLTRPFGVPVCPPGLPSVTQRTVPPFILALVTKSLFSKGFLEPEFKYDFLISQGKALSKSI